MRKLFLYPALFIGLNSALLGQSIAPIDLLLNRQQVDVYRASTNWLALSVQGDKKEAFFIDPTDLPYIKTLRELAMEPQRSAALLQRFLERCPSSLHRDEVVYLLGVLAIEEGDYPRALYHLKEVSESNLSYHRVAPYRLAYAYALMERYQPANRYQGHYGEISRLLEGALEREDSYAPRALMLLTLAKWQVGERKEAFAVMDEPKWWQGELLLPSRLEATLMAFDQLPAREAIARAQREMARHPELAREPRVQLMLGLAHYREGKNPQESIKLLAPLWQGAERELFNSSAAFALGDSYYRAKRYREAIAPLSYAATDQGRLGDLSQLLLGNTYMQLKETIEAINAYTLAARSEDRDLRLPALYNNALLQYERGVGNFGQSVKLALEVVQSYPETKEAEAMNDLMADIFYQTKDYKASLETISLLKKPGSRILEVKQYLFYKEAMRLLGESRGQEATNSFREALALGNRSAYYALSAYQEALRNSKVASWTEVERYAREAESTAHTEELRQQARYLKGYALYNTQRYQEAYKLFATLEERVVGQELRSDALLRMGDCLYQRKAELDKVRELYLLSDKILPGGNNLALFRLSDLYGLKGNYQAQVETIDKVLSRSEASSLTPSLLYTKARAQILMQKEDRKALETLKELRREYPASRYARLGGLEEGMLLYNMGDRDASKKVYKEIISSYSETREARSAVDNLKNIYLSEDKMDEFLSYTRSLPKSLSYSAEEEAHLRFMQLEERYRKGSANTIADLEHYLEQYPEATDSAKAKWLLCRRYLSQGEKTKAEALLLELSKEGVVQEIQTPALLELSKMRSQDGDYTKALAGYQVLLGEKALDREQQEEALIGALRAAYKLKDSKTLLSMSEESALSTLTGKNLEEARLLRARALASIKSYDEAVKQLSMVKADQNTPIGAEKVVLLAQIELERGRKKEAKERLRAMIEESTSEQYWLARAFILLSEIYYLEGDRYTASQYLESLQDNYPENNDDIPERIRALKQKYDSKR